MMGERKELRMGIFAKSGKPRGGFGKSSQREARERAEWAAARSGEAADAIKAYKKGKADKESVRRALAREDEYFRYTDE